MPQRRRQFRTGGRRRPHAELHAQHVQPQIPQLHHLPRAAARVELRFEVLAMRPAFAASILFASLLGSASAQPVVAPTPETVGSARGQNVGPYNFVDSVETGYRFADVSGNRGKYRSDENYRNGVQLLGSSFAVNSKEGHGGPFDENLLNQQGLRKRPYGT